MTLQLYGGAQSRASIVKWYLDEKAIPYDFILLDLKAGDQQKPDFLAINPMGKVPAIVDGEVTCWESGAILLYLADHYASTPLSTADRAALAQWVVFANATLGPSLFIESSREQEGDRILSALNSVLEKNEYLVGDDLSAADVAVGSYLAYAMMMLQLTYDDYGAIASYVTRLTQRPAFKSALGS